MAERVLPSRDHFADLIDDDSGAMAASEYRVLRAYALRELQTEAEWREAIDYEAMSEAVIALRKKPWGHSVDDGMTILDAALGMSDG